LKSRYSIGAALQSVQRFKAGNTLYLAGLQKQTENER
jgi:hypothetical protein